MEQKYRDKVEKKFWKKIDKFAEDAGPEVVEKALILYFCFTDEDTPEWALWVVISALVYFISPGDVVPDLIPSKGYSDDLSVLAGTITALETQIKNEHKQQASEELQSLFSD